MILKCAIIIALINQYFCFRKTPNYNHVLIKSNNINSEFKESTCEKVDWTQTLNLPVSNWYFHDFEKLENDSQHKWDNEGTYLQSILNNLGDSTINTLGALSHDMFRVICDGPPYANGQSHMGHLLNRTIKDIKLRYWLSQGYAAIIVPGWDCHGLPIELKAKKSLGTATLLEKCESLALNSIKGQALTTGKLGCWAFWGLSYGTILPLYKQLVQSTFVHLRNKNIICKGPLPVLYSPSACSVVADVEVEIKNVIRTCSYMPYQINDSDKIKSLNGLDFDKLFIVAYTTEPWTLLANQGLAVDTYANYFVYNNNNNNIYIMNGINPYGDWPKLTEINGSELIGLKYTDPLSGNVYKIINGENCVIFDVGTGIIHLSGAHNHTDFQLLVKAGIDTFRNVIDEKGRLIDYPNISAYSHELDDLLQSKIDILHMQNVVKKPFCRRTGGNIFTRITDQYWLNTGQLKPRVLEAINNISVIPNSAKNYLYKVVSSRPNHWCLSRQRPWGCKIIDNDNRLKLPLNDGPDLANDLTKVECLDVWFESGLNWMYNNIVLEYLINDFFPKNNNDTIKCSIGIVKSPDDDFKIGQNDFYEQFNKYVQENITIPYVNPSSKLYNKYLMVEGQDQHRGWFQSSLFTSQALNVDLPFEKIFSHGFVINEGEIKKVSKSKFDHGQADEFLSTYGADTLRLFIASSDFHQKDIYISKLSLERARDIRSRLCNTFKFILGLKKYIDLINDFTIITDSNNVISSQYPLDEAVLRQLEDLQKTAKENYESFNYSKIINKLKIFLKYLSTDYMSIIKDIIYTESIESSRAKSAFGTFEFIGKVLSQVVAPIVPHITQKFNDLFGTTTNLHSKWIDFSLSNNYGVEMELAHCLRDAVMIQLNRAVDAEVLKYFGQAKVNIVANANIKQLVDKWDGKTSDDLRLFLGVASIAATENGSECDIKVSVEKVNWAKCDRCWLYRESVNNRMINGHNHLLCSRCYDIAEKLKFVL
ncbi:Isoleucine--tRNA ligase [Babesia microti strain RI]|uniref:isoleucine--tRNA ligase n=1 Tax=Babesia microti (strain RI) TaxID=1133968 RepID=A0A1R4ACC4_BABMR|nr:Isoleucine--tRNA ligase [Babesia microti strain RI]SJK86669.1 Isoleucine--tRNA ligase [Babesia microti strain RI]|eukprot:XP_021338798.1 Isoleucine--tRNA ligase [Babesia microti strain RI]